MATSSAAASPMMLFGASKAAPKAAPKKVNPFAKGKVVPAKSVKGKKAAKPAYGPQAAQPGSNPAELAKSFFSEENWVYQTVTLLGDLVNKK